MNSHHNDRLITDYGHEDLWSYRELNSKSSKKYIS